MHFTLSAQKDGRNCFRNRAVALLVIEALQIFNKIEYRCFIKFLAKQGNFQE